MKKQTRKEPERTAEGRTNLKIIFLIGLVAFVLLFLLLIATGKALLNKDKHLTQCQSDLKKLDTSCEKIRNVSIEKEDSNKYVGHLEGNVICSKGISYLDLESINGGWLNNNDYLGGYCIVINENCEVLD